jgi:RHS repeat-associated protein
VNADGTSVDYFIVNGQTVAERWNYANGSEYFTMRYTFDETGSVIGFSTHYPEFVAGYWEDYLFAKNLQGDVVAMYLITVEPPRLIATYEYDEWGKVTAVRDATGAILTDPAHLANRNPFRYRSYHYDTETGFYYLQSRYYDPVISRFINADEQVSTSLGALGCNIFAYCLNNPTNKVDLLGNKPGDMFDTMDEAAKDFANYINAKSISENREYASYIYSKTITVKTFSHYETRRFLWWSWQAAVYTKSKKTVYTYRKPKKGTVDSSTPPINWFGRDKKVARLHTHAAYDPKYASDIFSDYYDKAGNRRGDKINAINAGMPTYVATPLGTLRRFDPSDGSDIVLFDDIPFDPNHPLR